MPGLLLIAHAPLASALKAVAEHTFPNCASQLAVLDVTPDMSAEAVEAAARALLAASIHTDWLILTDVFGATPSNAARQLLDSAGHRRMVSGVNAPMLWRSLCYAGEKLDSLVQLAAEGGKAGVVIADIPVNPLQSPESQ
jgi:PTS system ascorbate-specific IIA component